MRFLPKFFIFFTSLIIMTGCNRGASSGKTEFTNSSSVEKPTDNKILIGTELKSRSREFLDLGMDVNDAIEREKVLLHKIGPMDAEKTAEIDRVVFNSKSTVSVVGDELMNEGFQEIENSVNK